MENNNNQIVSINNSLANFERQITIGEKLLGLINVESDNFFYEDSPRGAVSRKEWFDSLTNDWKVDIPVQTEHLIPV